MLRICDTIVILRPWERRTGGHLLLLLLLCCCQCGVNIATHSSAAPAQLQRPSAVCLQCLVSSAAISINCVHCIDQLGTAVKCVPSNRTQTLHYRRGGAGAIVKWVPSVWVMVSGVGVLCTVYCVLCTQGMTKHAPVVPIVTPAHNAAATSSQAPGSSAG